MNTSTCLRLLAGLGLLAAAGSAPAATGAEQLRSFLDGLQTLRAQFHQAVEGASGERGEHSSGSLAIHRPGRFRWDYREPYPQQIVADGETIWIYDPELAQVTRQDQSAALQGSPAQILSGEGSLGDSFLVQDAGRSAGLAWVRLTPRDEQSQFEEVRLAFRDGVLRRMEMTDKLGQTSRLRFSQIRRNTALEDVSFSFEPPPGVDVLRR